MKKPALILGIIGLPFFALSIMWNIYVFIRDFIYSSTQIFSSGDGVGTAFTPSARYLINSAFIVLVYAVFVTAGILFIRMLLKLKNDKPISSAFAIALIVIFSLSLLSIIPPQMAAVPSYLILNRLGLLGLRLTLILPNIISWVGKIAIVISLILILVNNSNAKNRNSFS